MAQAGKGGHAIETALELVSVTRRFGGKTAVDGLSLCLEPGAFPGLLGRNGAGKSTTIKMATGLLPPTEGSVRVLGLDLEPNLLAVKRQIGVMPEELALLDRLTGPQYLRFVGRMYGLEDDVIDARRAELFERLDLRRWRRGSSRSEGLSPSAASACIRSRAFRCWGAELVAGLLNLLPLLGGLGSLSLALGLSVGAPLASPVFL